MTAAELASALEEQRTSGRRPRPGARRARDAHRDPARRRAGRADRAAASSTCPTSSSTPRPSPACRRRCAGGTASCRSALEDGRLVIAMSDPANVFAVDDVRLMTGMEVTAVVATRADVLAAIDRHHRGDAEMDELNLALAVPEQRAPTADATAVVEDAPIVKFVNLLISQAISDRASDIHIEPTEKDLRVRFRIDGVLHEVMRSPRTHHRGRDEPAQDHGRHRHRRAADPAGRPALGAVRRADGRPARRDPADGVGREDRHADPRQLDGQPRPGRPRLRGGATPPSSPAATSSRTG